MCSRTDQADCGLQKHLKWASMPPISIYSSPRFFGCSLTTHGSDNHLTSTFRIGCPIRFSAAHLATYPSPLKFYSQAYEAADPLPRAFSARTYRSRWFLTQNPRRPDSWRRWETLSSRSPAFLTHQTGLYWSQWLFQLQRFPSFPKTMAYYHFRRSTDWGPGDVGLYTNIYSPMAEVKAFSAGLIPQAISK